jgi:ketosteroid isomerase-like protein
MSTKDEVRAAFVRYLDALARGDIAAIEEMISRDPAALIVGSDPSEWWRGHVEAVAGLKRIFDKVGGLPVAPNEPAVFISGDLGWVVDRPRVNIPGIDIDFRMSFVFRREDNGWKLLHLHASRSVKAEPR